MILAGDIGGTSTRLAVFDVRDGRLTCLVEEVFPSQKIDGLEETASRFVSSQPNAITHATIGIAGTIRNDRVETKNLPWTVEGKSLARVLKLPCVTLLNDREANAHGIATLESSDFATLNEGRSASGNAAIISAGTGLGEAGLYWDGRKLCPFATEGGHADFSPRDDREMDLLRYLATKFGRVSYERVLSGPGVFTIYQFLRDTNRCKQNERGESAINGGHPSAEISKAALAGGCEICTTSMDMFISLYGAEAANLALKIMAVSGIYLGGGIAPKNLPKFREPTFMKSFTNKGRLRSLLEAIPVRVILNDKTALRGAARHAACSAGLMT